MEFASNTSNQQIGKLHHQNTSNANANANAIVTLKTKTAISATVNSGRGKSNTSSGKLNTTIGTMPKNSMAIPKTPQTSNKMKMLSAKKPKSTTSNSLIEEVGGAVGHFNSKINHQKKHSGNESYKACSPRTVARTDRTKVCCSPRSKLQTQ